MRHQVAIYRTGDDWEWSCTCGDSFGHSFRLATQHRTENEQDQPK